MKLKCIKDFKNVLIWLVTFQLLFGIFAVPTLVAAINTGPKSGANVTGWTGTANIGVSDNLYATTQTQSNVQTTARLRVSDFGLSIPTGAVIDGIAINMERAQTDANCLYDEGVMLMKNGAEMLSSNKAVSTPHAYLPTVDTSVAYGGPADRWGQTWTPAEVNNSGFGFYYYARNICSGSRSARIDRISATVYYTTPDSGTPTPTLELSEPGIMPDGGGVYTSNPPWHINVTLVGDRVDNATCEFSYKTSPTAWSAWLPGSWFADANQCYGDFTEMGANIAALTTTDFTGRLRVTTPVGTQESSVINRQFAPATVVTLNNSAVVVPDTTVLHVVTGDVNKPSASVTLSIHDSAVNADGYYDNEYSVSTNDTEINNRVVVDATGNWTATIQMLNKFPDGTYVMEVLADDGLSVVRAIGSYIVSVLPPDTLPPVITLAGINPINHLLGTPYVDAGASALDNVNGVVSVVTTGSVNVDFVGTNTITYTATDVAGNISTATRTVNVVATIKPGDANGDNLVDLVDLAIISYYWNTQSVLGDLNGDGWVNLQDLAILSYYWMT